MKPIIFNTEMVKAILKGRKTVTRRVIKPANGFSNRGSQWRQGNGLWIDGYTDAKEAEGSVKDYSVSSMWMRQEYYIKKYSRYKVGDKLYVRETYADKWTPDGLCGYVYRADGKPASFPYWGNDKQCKDEVWIPSIHMPKVAARLFLKVTDVRIERLQDISEEDCYAEGTNPNDDACYENNGWSPRFYDPDSGGPCIIEDGFQKLWNSTIKKQDIDLYGWDANPWVWVIEFEVV